MLSPSLPGEKQEKAHKEHSWVSLHKTEERNHKKSQQSCSPVLLVLEGSVPSLM